jgi:para-nitrobenzyl esterase
MTGGSVQTTYGPVAGVERDGVQVFRGIRYATPPTGERRFRPPEPPEPWTEVQDAGRSGPVAPQNPSPLESLFGADPPPQSEDCLFLDVWTPATDDTPRPVMVWIHGGAFVTGSGSTPWYDGSSFAARHDIVLVTINYRLGALGFSHLADLGGPESAGNLGILDQAFALRWVRDNIAAFGGDPGNVTIFGESAGGMSVATLLGLPEAAGLFHKAIPQSGAARHVRSRERATEITTRLLDELGVDIDGLLTAPVARILAAQAAVTAAGGRIEAGLPFSPVHDGTALPEPPFDAVIGGSAAGVPLLTGTNLDEMLLFTFLDPAVADLDDERLAARAASLFGDDAVHEALDAYRSGRPGCGPGEVWSALLTDLVFRVPAVRLAEQQAKHAPVYTYLFTWATPAFGGKLGSCHALEIPFVFNSLHARGVHHFVGEVDDGLRALAATVHDAWAAFARTGDPNHEGLPAWPRFAAPERPTMLLGDACAVEHDPAGHELAVWASVP